MAVRNSVRTATGAYTNDFLQYSGFPGNAALFGCWCKGYVADPTLPIAHDNFVMLGTAGSNWSIYWLIDNMNIDASHVVTRWNSNCMLFANSYYDGSGWANDYCLYVTYDVQTEAEALGWKWVGCQVILGVDSVTLRQWVKFGLTGTPIKTGETVRTFTQMRTDLVNNAGWTQAAADAWTPTDLSSFRWGKDGNESSGIVGDIVYAKAVAMSDEPSISTLNTMALDFSANTSLWGDWTHDWVDGAPVLVDRSGNSRSLSSGGGVLLQGDAFDDGVSEGVTGTVSGSQVIQAGEASGTLAFSATSSGSQIAQSGAAVATLAYSATGSGTQTIQSGAAVGALAFSATVGGQQATQTGDATGIEAFTGTISGEQPRQTGAAEGSVVAEGIIGSVSGTQSIQSGESAGVLEFFIIGLGVQIVQTGEAVGYIGDVSIIGTVSGTQDVQTGSAEGLEAFTGIVTGEQARQTGGSSYVPVPPASTYIATASAEVRQGSVAGEIRSVRVSV